MIILNRVPWRSGLSARDPANAGAPPQLGAHSDLAHFELKPLLQLDLRPFSPPTSPSYVTIHRGLSRSVTV